MRLRWGMRGGGVRVLDGDVGRGSGGWVGRADGLGCQWSRKCDGVEEIGG